LRSEDFDPGKPGADAERGASERTQHQAQHDKQRDFHGCVFACRCPQSLGFVGAGHGEVQRCGGNKPGAAMPKY